MNPSASPRIKARRLSRRIYHFDAKLRHSNANVSRTPGASLLLLRIIHEALRDKRIIIIIFCSGPAPPWRANVSRTVSILKSVRYRLATRIKIQSQRIYVTCVCVGIDMYTYIDIRASKLPLSSPGRSYFRRGRKSGVPDSSTILKTSGRARARHTASHILRRRNPCYMYVSLYFFAFFCRVRRKVFLLESSYLTSALVVFFRILKLINVTETERKGARPPRR